MRLKSIKIIYFALFVLCFYSCNKGEKTEDTVIKITYNKAYSILQTQFLMNPDTIFLSNFSNYFAAENEIFLIVIMDFGETWQEIYRIEKYINLKIHDVDWVLIDSIPYIYFITEDHGNTIGNVCFTVVSLTDIKKYFIPFSGDYSEYGSQYDIMGTISEELKDKKNILLYLEEKIAKSNLIYHPTEKDLNIDDPKNYSKKWKILNKNIYNTVKNNIDSPINIEFPFYEFNLFDNIRHGSVNSSVENQRWIIKAFFKDDVIGYDKANKEYFVLWIPETQQNSIHEIEFTSSNSISMKNFFEEYFVELIDKKITSIYNE